MFNNKSTSFTLFICLLLLLTFKITAQTITSTTTGGRWNSTATWVGGVVPNINNDVVIAGTVRFQNGDGTCKNLTINSGATLQNNTGYAFPEQILTVNGNVTNNGTINNGGSSGFALIVTGNVTNNGTWVHNRTELSGSSNQILTLGSGKIFDSNFKVTDAVGQIVAGSALYFTGGFELNKSTFDMKNLSLTLRGSSANVNNGTVVNTADLVGRKNPTNSTYPVVVNILFDGNINLKGILRIDWGVSLKGSVVVTDTLENSTGYAHPEKKLTVIGNFTNNGLVRNGGSAGFALNISGNVTNNGTWVHNRTELSGSSNQILTLGIGKIFDSPFKVTDQSGQIVAGSALLFTSGFDLNKCSFDLQKFALTLRGSSANIHNGLVFNGIDIVGRKHPTNGSYPVVSNILYDGKLNLKGILRIDWGVSMRGSVTVVDTIENSIGYAHPEKILKIIGELTNNGLIRDGGSAGFVVDVTGNIIANKKINNKRVQLAGTGNRTIFDKLSTVQYLSTGEKVGLTGINYLPNLSISSTSKCMLVYGAKIFVPNDNLDEKLDNWSEISITRIATSSLSYNFFMANLSLLSTSGIDSIKTQSFGHQVPPTYPGAVKCWWKLTSYTKTTSPVTLSSLSLKYTDELLGSNIESALKLYHSEDHGKTWKQISTSSNFTLNTTTNTAIIKDVPGVGDYLLSSTADPSSVRPSIVVNILGRDQIRIGGAPNRYTIAYSNNSDAYAEDFLLTVFLDKYVHIKSAELPKSDGTKIIYPVDSLVYDKADSAAVFYVVGMNPREERTFDIIVTSDLPSLNKSSAKMMVEPLSTIAAAAVTYVVTKYGAKIVCKGIEYIGEKTKEQLAPTPEDREKFNQLFPITNKELMEENKKENILIKPLKKEGEKLAKKLITKTMGIVGGAYDIGASTIKAIKGIVPNLRLKLWVRIQEEVGFFGPKETTTEEISSKSEKKAKPVYSIDPNEKIGPTGFGTNNFITSAGKMNYQILFENKKEATAPAWKVTIIDTLGSNYDPESFVFGKTSHDGPQHNWIMTRTGNIVKWEIEGIELPPNVKAPEGEGWVSFTVNTKPNLPSGTAIKNKASIVFDMNKPIITNEFVNTLDFKPPTTVMKGLTPNKAGNKLVVRWNSTDDINGSGIESVTIYGAKNNSSFNELGSTSSDSLEIILDNNTHTYSFYALAKDNVGNAETIRPKVISATVTNSVESLGEGIPTVYSLEQNYPNPFNPSTIIRFAIPRKSKVLLEVFDLLGQRVSQLVNEELMPSNYEVRFNGKGLASGLYFYKLSAGDFTQSKKMLLIK